MFLLIQLRDDDALPNGLLPADDRRCRYLPLAVQVASEAFSRPVLRSESLATVQNQLICFSKTHKFGDSVWAMLGA